MMLDRRALLGLLGGISLGPWANLPFIRPAAAAEDPKWRHGLSLFNAVKYPVDFTHFDYVNPDAPKGGRARMYSLGSFDSLNPFTFKGSPAGLIGQTVDTLMVSAFDEPSSEYGLIAEAVTHPEDFSSVTYRLRPEARFHDGEPIKPEDVIWSMEALKAAHPQYAYYYQNVEKAEKTGEREVTFRFSATGNRELPQITGQLPVLAKHWWTGTNDKGEQRNINETTLEIPLGSGAYKVSEVKAGQSITLARVDDYWAKDLPVNRGQNNFDELVLIYFRDQSVALEGFKGDLYDWRVENTAKDWATAYDFPAVTRGDVVLEKIELSNGAGMQAFVFNTRRDKFKDPRVRLAFNYAFDFEWANTNLFFGQYKRTNSFFSNSELAATGLPGPGELAYLEPLRGEIPAEVFTSEFTNPINPSPQDRRKNLREAAKLLKEAGWSIGPNRKLRNAAGEAFTVEFLLVSPAFERVVLPYVQQLNLLGIDCTVRTVDSAQYERRVQNFEYDVIVGGWGQSLSPGNEQRDFWGSAAADRLGSRNLAGIKSKAIDQLIDDVIYAKSRDELVSATRALDRVLLWNHYVVPMWHIPYERTARWNRFGKPETMPEYSDGFPSIWWWDTKKAASVKSG